MVTVAFSFYFKLKTACIIHAASDACLFTFWPLKSISSTSLIAWGQVCNVSRLSVKSKLDQQGTGTATWLDLEKDHSLGSNYFFFRDLCHHVCTILYMYMYIYLKKPVLTVRKKHEQLTRSSTLTSFLCGFCCSCNDVTLFPTFLPMDTSHNYYSGYKALSLRRKHFCALADGAIYLWGTAFSLRDDAISSLFLKLTVEKSDF